MRRVFLGKTQQDLLGDGDKLVLEILGEPSTPAPTATAEEQTSGARPPSSQTAAGGGRCPWEADAPGWGPAAARSSQALAEAQRPFSGGCNSLFSKWRTGPPHGEKGAMATPSHLAQRDVRHLVDEDGRPGGWERGPPADPEGGRSSCPTGSRERRGSEPSCCSTYSKETVPL